jgi:hypothetical protein
MAILPRYKRLRRRDWKDPFSWFNWFQQTKPDPVFLYRPSGGRTGQISQSFARADSTTCATYVDSTGVVRTVAANILRDGHHHYDGSHLKHTTLREAAGTNLVIQSQDLGTGWSALGSATLSLDATTAPDGTATADRVNAALTSSAYYRSVTFTADATKAVSVFIKQGTASVGEVWLYDSSAAAQRHTVRFTWSGGVPTLSTVGGAGTLYPVQALANGWYRIAFSADGVVAANTNDLRLYPDRTVGTGTCYFWGMQAENATVPSSYIATTTGAVTRAADVWSFVLPYVPRALTAYVDCYDLGATAQASARLWEIGTGSNPQLLVYQQSSSLGLYTHNGTSAKDTGAPAGSPAYGGRIESRGVLNTDGSLVYGQSLNSGTETTATATALALASAWSSTKLSIGSSGAGTVGSNIAIRSIVFVLGPEQSMAKMRLIARS